VLGERFDGALRQDERALRLRRLSVAAAARRAPHVDDAVRQVDVVPGEPAQFVRAQAERDREHEQRFEPYAGIRVLVEPELSAAQAAGRLG
jgi:hypothetical protein